MDSLVHDEAGICLRALIFTCKIGEFALLALANDERAFAFYRLLRILYATQVPLILPVDQLCLVIGKRNVSDRDDAAMTRRSVILRYQFWGGDGFGNGQILSSCLSLLV